MQLLKVHTPRRKVIAIAFSPDGSRLASVGDDGMVRLWDLRGGSSQMLSDRCRSNWIAIKSLAFSPDGHLLAWCDLGTVVLHDLTAGTTKKVVVEGSVYRPPCAVFPSGNHSLLHAQNGIRKVDLTTQAVSAPWARTEGAHLLAVTADGKSLASGHSFLRHSEFGDGQEVQLRNLNTGRMRTPWPVIGPYLSGVAISPDGNRIAATCGPMLYVWDTEKPEAMATIHGIDRRHYFTGLDFSPDGRFLAVGRNDRTVYFWRTATWEIAARFDWKIGNPADVKFSPDGLRAAACGNYGKIVVWDVDL